MRRFQQSIQDTDQDDDFKRSQIFLFLKKLLTIFSLRNMKTKDEILFFNFFYFCFQYFHSTDIFKPVYTDTHVSADSHKYFIFIRCVDNKFFNIEFAIQHILSTCSILLMLSIVLYHLNFYHMEISHSNYWYTHLHCLRTHMITKESFQRLYTTLNDFCEYL